MSRSTNGPTALILKIRTSGGYRVNIHFFLEYFSSFCFIDEYDVGIFRDVYLLAFPQTGHIEDFFVRTYLQPDSATATLDIDLLYNVESSASVSLSLRDSNGRLIVPPTSHELESSTSARKCKLEVRNPQKWTAEHPNLYYLTIAMTSSKKQIQEIVQQVGFRTVSIKEGLLRVNEEPIMFHGVNRHDHHPRFGRAVPLDFIRHDLMLMKQHNMNAVRCSHYPNDPRLVQLANEIGLYVIDEADCKEHPCFRFLFSSALCY